MSFMQNGREADDMETAAYYHRKSKTEAYKSINPTILMPGIYKNLLTATLILLSFSLSKAQLHSQSQSPAYRLLLAGASFSYPENTWFETGCKKLNAIPINKGNGKGGSIVDLANSMAAGSFYSLAELDSIDALIIMHVHEKDVFYGKGLKENLKDYTPPFSPDDYAEAYDYAIKRYTADCYSLKSNPASRYYGKPFGKPAALVLSTHWHDARTLYNESVRRLAAKWGLPLIEFDKYIGFSKDQLHPVTKEQYSLIFSLDTQVINGVKYGWHPIRGEQSYIQQRMAAIFADLMQKTLPIR